MGKAAELIQARRDQMARAVAMSDEEHLRAIHEAQRGFNVAVLMARDKGLRVDLTTFDHIEGPTVSAQVWREIRP